MGIKEEVFEALSKVNFPGFKKDIVSTGVVEGVDATPDSITISLKKISADELTIGKLKEDIHKAVTGIAAGAEIYVAVGHSQAAGQGAPAPEETVFIRGKLKGVKHVVPVSSGKGGVGKSTIAVNLAFTLVELGHKTGILDLDIFGPSVHKMLGAEGRLEMIDNLILPSDCYGIKVISVGMAVEDSEAMILRGPMVMKLIDQLINHVNWGELDYLIVDLPPGTGDVPLSLTQQLAIAGSVLVTTPQDVALIDVRRSVSMFRKTETHILGIVENMSHYVCEKCGDIAHIFGQGGGAMEAEKLGIPLLATIPLTKAICEEADKGSPIVNHDKSPELHQIFVDLANNVIKGIEEAPTPLSPPETFSAIGQGGAPGGGGAG